MSEDKTLPVCLVLRRPPVTKRYARDDVDELHRYDVARSVHARVSTRSPPKLYLRLRLQVRRRKTRSRPSRTLVGLSELSLETAPTLMSASNSTPSMVRSFGSG